MTFCTLFVAFFKSTLNFEHFQKKKKKRKKKKKENRKEIRSERVNEDNKLLKSTEKQF